MCHNIYVDKVWWNNTSMFWKCELRYPIIMMSEGSRSKLIKFSPPFSMVHCVICVVCVVCHLQQRNGDNSGDTVHLGHRVTWRRVLTTFVFLTTIESDQLSHTVLHDYIMTSQMLWPSDTTNCGCQIPQKWLLCLSKYWQMRTFSSC